MVAPLHVTRRAQVAGVLAVGVSLAVTELCAGLSEQVPSAVGAVGDVFVDGLPGWAVRGGIDSLGTNDKPFLLTTIVVVSLLIGLWLGKATLRRRWVGPVGFGLAGLFGAWACARDPFSGTFASIVACALAAAAGAAVLLKLVDLAEATRDATAAEPVRPGPGAAGRRTFLVWAAATGALAAVGGSLGRRLSSRFSVEGEREALTLPDVEPAASVRDLGEEGLTPFVVPNEDFYRIDTALIVPQVSPDDWTLKVTGLVDHELELTFEELLARPQIEELVTLSCVSNEVGGDLVGNARWQGTLLADLLREAGPTAEAEQVLGVSVDGFTAGFPLEIAMDGRPAIVAVGMNGEPLPIVHGFPARLVVPGLYGYVSATKWLSEIRLTTSDVDGYWIPRGWSKDGPIKTESRIDVPRSGSAIDAGATPIAGVAWAPTRGIDRVEVQVDDGEWQEARLGDGTTDLTWRQWVVEWDAPAGDHEIRVRATDGTGETQTEEIAPVAPSGATGWHTISVHVE